MRRGLTVDEIAATMLALVRPLPAVDVAVADSLGCVLASPVVTAADLPPWPVATRDGYAVRSADTTVAACGDSVRLRVIGEVAAGDRPDPLSARCTFRIMTGARIPDGADAVVPAEWGVEERHGFAGALGAPGGSGGPSRPPMNWVEIVRPVTAGQFVASTGAEFEAGSAALLAGTVLGPPELAVLAALGHAHVRVVPRPRVALVATGTELSRQAGLPLAGEVRASNVALVQAMVTACGATVSSVRVASDDPADLTIALRDALAADLILTTGGTGRSSSDIVGRVLQDQETDSLWNAPVRGSKPAAFRVLRQAPTERLVPHLALPGRPIAAMVAFILFAYPLLRRLSGLRPNRACYRWARLAAAIDGIAGRHRYVPVHLERCRKGWQAVPGGEPSLYGLAATAGTDGFAVLGRRTAGLVKGHRVRVLLPPWGTGEAT